MQPTITYPIDVTICDLTQSEFQALSDSIVYHQLRTQDDTALRKWEEYLSYSDDPPCLNNDSCDEDTTTGNIFDFIDGVVGQLQSGGVVRAIGYAIENLGTVIINTSLKLIALTVIGTVAPGVLTILVGGSVVDSIDVLPDNVLDLIIDTGLDGITAAEIEFRYEAA